MNRKIKKIVITGGPGGGKTAILELARKKYCNKVAILPESATILFTGGFIRSNSIAAKKAIQRAIFHTQKELERLVDEENLVDLILCDRGSLDSLAYWPESEESFWQDVRSSKIQEIWQYDTVIHLTPPSINNGYENYSNPIRIESAEEASIIDKKILEVWKDHPHRFIIDSTDDFMKKVSSVIFLLEKEIPDSCRINKKILI